MGRLRTLIGLGLLVAGNLVLLQRIAESRQSFDVGRLWQWAPLLLVVAGLIGVLRLLDAKQAFRGPLFMIALGSLLLLITVERLARVWAPWAWGVGALLVGWWLVASGRRSSIGEGLRDWPRELCVFDTRHFINNSDSFRSGTIIAIFGGCTYDLRLVMPADNDPRLDVTAIFGGVDLILPHDWTVDFQPRKIFGVCRNLIPQDTSRAVATMSAVSGSEGTAVGSTDTPASAAQDAPSAQISAPRVTVSALAILGGIDLRQAP
jgi:hypothetical protein